VQEALRAQALRRMLWQSLLALGVMAVISVGLGWLAAGRALRPIQAITRTARHASEGSLHERIGLDGPQDELKELADTLDGMLSRLEVAFQAQRRFVANASHELRTPLAIMRTALDVALCSGRPSAQQVAEMAAELRTAVGRAEALTESLLTLARSDQDVRAHEYFDLADGVQDALEAVESSAAERRLAIASRPDPAPVWGDRALLETMIGNLLRNSVRHNVEGGSVSVRTGTEAGQAFVIVANSGRPVPADLVPRLFEPFQRGDGERAPPDRGVGLGLSIVRAVALNHGGEVSARALAEGGLEVTVRLPLARPAAGAV
jgi:signal transduction histidine kinase